MPSRPPRTPPPPSGPGHRSAPPSSGPAAPSARRFPPPKPFARPAAAQPKAPPASSGGQKRLDRPPPPFPPAARTAPKAQAVQRAKIATGSGSAGKSASDSGGYVPPAYVPRQNAASDQKAAGGYTPPVFASQQSDSAPADAKATAADAKETGTFVAMHHYGAGTGTLWTTPLGNCVAIIAYEEPRHRAALTHYNTGDLFLDIFNQVGTAAVGDEHLPTVTTRLNAVKQRLLRELPGVTASNVSYRIVLGMVWDTPTLVNKAGSVMWQALAQVFGIEQSALAPLPVGMTARFDAATGILTWSTS